MNKLFPSACIKSHPPCWDRGWPGHWTKPGAGPVCAGVMPRAGQCGLLGVMKAVSSPAQPAGGHTTLQKTLCRQFLQTTPQTNQFGSQMCGQLISVIRCTYNFLLPLSSYTLFRVVNFRCADMRLLFFQFITIKAVFKCNIQTTVSLPCVSLQSVSAGSVFCKFSVRECSYELSFELSAVVKWKWMAVGVTLGIIVMELDLGWGYLLYFINVMGGQTTSIKIITN